MTSKFDRELSFIFFSSSLPSMDLLSLLRAVPTLFCNEIFPWLFSLETSPSQPDDGRESGYVDEFGFYTSEFYTSDDSDDSDDFSCAKHVNVQPAVRWCLRELIGSVRSDSEAAEKWNYALQFLLSIPQRDLFVTVDLTDMELVVSTELRAVTSVVRDLSLVCTAMRAEMTRCADFHRFTVFCLALDSATLKRLRTATLATVPGIQPDCSELVEWWARLNLPGAAFEEALLARNRRNLAEINAMINKREYHMLMIDARRAAMQHDKEKLAEEITGLRKRYRLCRRIAEDVEGKGERAPAKKRGRGSEAREKGKRGRAAKKAKR